MEKDEIKEGDESSFSDDNLSVKIIKIAIALHRFDSKAGGLGLFPRQHEKIMPFLEFYEVLNKLAAENDERRLYGALAGYCKLGIGHAYISFLTLLTLCDIGLVNPEI